MYFSDTSQTALRCSHVYAFTGPKKMRKGRRIKEYNRETKILCAVVVVCVARNEPLGLGKCDFGVLCVFMNKNIVRKRTNIQICFLRSWCSHCVPDWDVWIQSVNSLCVRYAYMCHVWSPREWMYALRRRIVWDPFKRRRMQEPLTVGNMRWERNVRYFCRIDLVYSKSIEFN